MTTLTKSERLVLEFLDTLRPSETRPLSALGYAIWEAADAEDRKPNPSPQGMALLAGRHIGRLRKKHWLDYLSGSYKITEAGRLILKDSK